MVAVPPSLIESHRRTGRGGRGRRGEGLDLGAHRGYLARDGEVVPPELAVHDNDGRARGIVLPVRADPAGASGWPASLNTLTRSLARSEGRVTLCWIRGRLMTRSPQVHIPMDTKTNQAKGLAYVTFVQPADAVAAFKALDGTTFQGRLLHILPAMGRAPKTANGSTDPKSLKQERLELRKQNAGQAFSWGTLYLNVRAARREKELACFLRGAFGRFLRSERDGWLITRYSVPAGGCGHLGRGGSPRHLQIGVARPFGFRPGRQSRARGSAHPRRDEAIL